MLLCKGQTTLHAEVGVVFQCLFYLMRVSFQIIRFGIEHRQTHPTTDVHPYGIGDDGIVRGEYTTDGQTVSGMCIGHQCPGYADGEPHGQVHLLFGEGFYELAAIGFIGQRLVEQVVCCELLFDERGGQVFGQFAPCLILFISIGVSSTSLSVLIICSLLWCLQCLPTMATTRLRATLSLYPSLLKSFNRIPIFSFSCVCIRHGLPASKRGSTICVLYPMHEG